jgi:acyl-coenzyme A synthetase/AMP-(fatty) acid ligase
VAKNTITQRLKFLLFLKFLCRERTEDRIAMAPSAIIPSVIVMTAILASGAATKVLNPVHSEAQMAEFIRLRAT